MSIQEQSETKYNASDSPSKAGSVGLWFVFFLGLCLLTAGLWSGWRDYTQASKNQGPELAQRVVPAGLAHATMDKSTAKPGLIEIRKIQPGMRVEAFNPEVSDEERESWPTIDHKRWFALSVLLIGGEGEPVYLELIRPVEWVLALDAQEGHEVWLDLPELNSKGWGRVTKLKRCQPFEEGPGRVVTGTFTRRVRNVVNLHVEELKAPIGVTQNHPIWSEDRQAFVQAGSLQAGERLRSMIGGEGGGIAHVTAITPRGPPGHRETVFNLEVEGEHAYQVSGLGLVVHNNYGDKEVVYQLKDTAGNIVYFGITNDPLRRFREHVANFGKVTMEVLTKPLTHDLARTYEGGLIRLRLSQYAQGASEKIVDFLSRAKLWNKNRGREAKRWEGEADDVMETVNNLTPIDILQ